MNLFNEMKFSKKKKIRVFGLSLIAYILILWILDAYQIHFPFKKVFLYFGYTTFVIVANYEAYMNYKAKKKKNNSYGFYEYSDC